MMYFFNMIIFIFGNFIEVCQFKAMFLPTGTGVRLYYTTMPLIGGLPQRPSQLTLLHVRLPPGFAANATVYRPTKVHKALYSHGMF